MRPLPLPRVIVCVLMLLCCAAPDAVCCQALNLAQVYRTTV